LAPCRGAGGAPPAFPVHQLTNRDAIAIHTESRPKADGSLTTSRVLVPIVVHMDIARTQLAAPACAAAASFINRITLSINGGKHLSRGFR
jgi:hypothetical protein